MCIWLRNILAASPARLIHFSDMNLYCICVSVSACRSASCSCVCVVRVVLVFVCLNARVALFGCVFLFRISSLSSYNWCFLLFLLWIVLLLLCKAKVHAADCVCCLSVYKVFYWRSSIAHITWPVSLHWTLPDHIHAESISINSFSNTISDLSFMQQNFIEFPKWLSHKQIAKIFIGYQILLDRILCRARYDRMWQLFDWVFF